MTGGLVKSLTVGFFLLDEILDELVSIPQPCVQIFPNLGFTKSIRL